MESAPPDLIWLTLFDNGGGGGGGHDGPKIFLIAVFTRLRGGS